MKLHALLLAASSILVCTTASAVVVSGPDTSGHDWWREGATAPWSFGKLDRNSDGKVSQGEMAEARQQFAAALKETKASLQAAVDLDQSGKLSRYEAAEGSARWISLRERARELAVAANDKNHDGKVGSDESMGLEQRIGAVFVRYGAATVDTNQDRNFSRPEVQAAINAIKAGKGAMFTLCDRSNDGQLSISEVDMAFDILAAAAGIHR